MGPGATERLFSLLQPRFSAIPTAGTLQLALGQENPYPELAQGVDVLGLEEGIIITVHQALPVDHSGIVHQDGDVTHLRARGGCGAVRAASPWGLYPRATDRAPQPPATWLF